MDRKTVENYKGICAQIVAEKALKVSDTVTASLPEYPYSKHTLTITGTEDNPHSQKLHKLERQKAEIEEAIWGLEDGIEKAVISMHVLAGMAWGEMAASLGGCYTVDGLKQVYRRGMKKHF